MVARDPATRDFYNQSDPLSVTAAQRRKAAGANAESTPDERAARATSDNFYRLNFRNIGGLVMPVIVKMDFADGSTETMRIPAEVWRYNPKAVTWQYVTGRTLARTELDPLLETADADRSNSVYSGRIEPLTLELESAPETQNRLRDSDVKVTPDSTRAVPAPVSK